VLYQQKTQEPFLRKPDLLQKHFEIHLAEIKGTKTGNAPHPLYSRAIAAYRRYNNLSEEGELDTAAVNSGELYFIICRCGGQPVG
jgi:hypothetical protein